MESGTNIENLSGGRTRSPTMDVYCLCCMLPSRHTITSGVLVCSVYINIWHSNVIFEKLSLPVNITSPHHPSKAYWTPLREISTCMSAIGHHLRSRWDRWYGRTSS